MNAGFEYLEISNAPEASQLHFNSYIEYMLITKIEGSDTTATRNMTVHNLSNLF